MNKRSFSLQLKGLLALCLTFFCAVAFAESAPAPSLDDFLRRDAFGEMRLSPDGQHIAATVPMGDRGGLVIFNRASMSRTAAVKMPKNLHVADIYWVNDERLVYSLAEKHGLLEQPQMTGELVGINVDGSQNDVLAGPRNYEANFSHIRKANQMVYAEWIGRLPGNEKEVLVSVYDNANFNQVERMDVRDGRRRKLADAPVRQASFALDLQGEVRFAYGEDDELNSKLFHRKARGEAWTLVSEEAEKGEIASAIGFLRDGHTALLQISQERGPDAIYRYDPDSGERSKLLADAVVDPSGYLYSPEDGSVYAVVFDGPQPRVEYLDAEHPYARAHASMAANFPGQLLLPVSSSREGRQILFFVHSDRNPGDFYLLDRVAKKAEYIASRAQWIDPEQMAATRPVELKARDGVVLHGFLTLPRGSEGNGVPLVVNPHGGPFGISDSWLFDNERQLLAAHGYAVLQVNFRGSGNYGAEFLRAGARQWGRLMQDDLTDATRWAVEQGIADPQRICIYGGSYGGYAALMGAAREPGLYRCAIGNVGVYELPLMFKIGDTEDSVWGRNFLKASLGEDDLESISPTRLAAQIKVPVLLAAGEEDERAPPKHTELMRDALERAGVPVEAVIYEGEGHGYYQDESRRDYYGRVLAFLQRHIGSGQGKSAAP